MKSSGAIPKNLGARSKIKLSYDSQISNGHDPDFKGNMKNHKSNKSLVLSNDDKSLCPLEKKEIFLTLEGVQLKKPALDRYWIAKRSYLHFQTPPSISTENSIVGATEAWIEQSEFLIEDLSWLLREPHYRFWSQMIYDSSIHECLESYLTNGPRWFNEDDVSREFCSIIEQVHNLVFRVYLRMATNKEAKDDFITPSTFGKLIYDNFLFDVCSMLDLCALYGSANESLLSKMLTNIFTNQPKYLEDLAEMATSLKQLLESLQARMVILNNTSQSNGPLSRQEYVITYDHLLDTIQYLLDIFSSIHALFRIFPRAIAVFHSCDYHLSLCNFYEHVIPILEENIPSASNFEDEQYFDRLRSHMRHIRMDALAIYRLTVKHFCLDGIGDPGGAGKCTEEFIHLMSTCVEEKLFTVDYASAYDLDTDLNMLQNVGADPTSLNFIKEAVQLVIDETRPNFENEETENINCNTDMVESNLTCSDNSGMNGYYVGETCSISDIEIASLVSQIQDLLPDLGSGFIAKCLKYYNYSSEDTLNALLAGPLPPCLDTLDRLDSEIMKPDLKPDQKQISPSLSEYVELVKDEEHPDEKDILAVRSNVYNDDEFDIFSKTVKPNLNKMHKGKRKEDVAEKDASLVEKVKALALEYDTSQGYSIYDDEDRYAPLAEIEYEDEYDDTYDNDYTGDMDVGEKKIRVPTFRGKGAINEPMAYSESEESDDEEGGDSSQKGAFRPFCRNPEDLRKKAEERRQAKFSNKSKNQSWKTQAAPQPAVDAKPKPPTTQTTAKGSGKQWRSDPDDERFKHGGNRDDKQTTSQHGKAQDKTYKQKMVNKGNFRRSAAQAKQRSFM